MKSKNILLVFLIVLGYSVSGQRSMSPVVCRMDFIQADIQRIDKLDGKEDSSDWRPEILSMISSPIMPFWSGPMV
jgi:hypothetical protein